MTGHWVLFNTTLKEDWPFMSSNVNDAKNFWIEIDYMVLRSVFDLSAFVISYQYHDYIKLLLDYCPKVTSFPTSYAMRQRVRRAAHQDEMNKASDS